VIIATVLKLELKLKPRSLFGVKYKEGSGRGSRRGTWIFSIYIFS
jgi:hypothetical protein